MAAASGSRDAARQEATGQVPRWCYAASHGPYRVICERTLQQDTTLQLADNDIPVYRVCTHPHRHLASMPWSAKADA
jgi:hypothetical protein